MAATTRNHPLVAFFILAYLLSWWFLLLGGGNFPYGPFLAALIVTAAVSGGSGVKALLRRLVLWRVGLQWYAAALLLPVVVVLPAVYLNVLFGAAPAPSSSELGRVLLQLPFFFLFVFVVAGPLGEELGWRGYALPRLQAGRSALLASLILGALTLVWHLPLFFVGGLPPNTPVLGFALFAFAIVIPYTWFYNQTGGSVLLVMLFHAMNNTLGFSLGTLTSGADAARGFWLWAVLWSVAAIIMVVVSGPTHLSRKHRKQEEPARQPEVTTATPRVV